MMNNLNNTAQVSALLCEMFHLSLVALGPALLWHIQYTVHSVYTEKTVSGHIDGWLCVIWDKLWLPSFLGLVEEG